MILNSQINNANFSTAFNQRTDMAIVTLGALINQSKHVSADQLATTANDLSNYWLASLHLTYDKQLEQRRHKLRHLIKSIT